MTKEKTWKDVIFKEEDFKMKPKPYKEEWLAQWDEKETPLSEKEYMMFNEKGFKTKDLKQALKRLKEVMFNYLHNLQRDSYTQSIISNKLGREIDKIFGEELTQ